MINIPSDNDHLVYLSLETVVNGHSVLIFCPTKNWCEKVADTVAKEFFNLGKPSKVPDKNDRVRKYFFNFFPGVVFYIPIICRSWHFNCYNVADL